jgi:hypothetical protein
MRWGEPLRLRFPLLSWDHRSSAIPNQHLGRFDLVHPAHRIGMLANPLHLVGQDEKVFVKVAGRTNRSDSKPAIRSIMI